MSKLTKKGLKVLFLVSFLQNRPKYTCSQDKSIRIYRNSLRTLTRVLATFEPCSPSPIVRMISTIFSG